MTRESHLCEIFDAEHGLVVADSLHPSEGDRIVRAVNSHASLVEAMEFLLQSLPIALAATGRPGGADPRNELLQKAKNIAIKALAKARGEDK
jgi:hypothetical protein